MSKQFLLHSEPRGSRKGFMRRDEGCLREHLFFDGSMARADGAAVEIDPFHRLIQAVVKPKGKFQVLGGTAGVSVIHPAVEFPHGQKNPLPGITGHNWQGGEHQGCNRHKRFHR